MKFYYYSLVFFVLLFAGKLQSKTFNFRHYKVEDGLSSNSVSSIIQDRHGFIWMTSEVSLNRFDGYSFKEFSNKKNGKIIPWCNYTTSMLEVKNGDIWIGTDNGINIFDPQTEKIGRFTVKTDNIEISGRIINMVQDNFGHIWITTHGQGIFQYNPETKKLEQYKIIQNGSKKSAFTQLNCIFVDKSNQVWAASRAPFKGLLLFNRSANCFQPFDFKGCNEILICKIIEDSQSGLWLGTWDKGICRLDKKNKTVTKYLSPELKGGISHIHEICTYSSNELLIGSDDGLSLFNTVTGSQQLFTSNEIDPLSLSDKFVYPILKDHEGGIWIGTYFGGINYVSPNSGAFERYSHSSYVNSVNGNIIGGFCEDKKGNIWIASDDGGLNCLNSPNKYFTHYLPQPGRSSISYDNIHALCCDDDNLWIGTYTGGLNILNLKTGRFKLYNSKPNDLKTIDMGSIYALFKDRDKQIWAGSMSGINLYNRLTDDFTRIKSIGATIVDIEQDKAGFIWFATLGKGLFCFSPTTKHWKNYRYLSNQNNSIPSDMLNCILSDTKGQLWIGTTNGLCLYDNKTEKFIPVNLDTPNNNICCIIEDQNILWLTTNKGLIRYNILEKSCQVFNKSDGLLSDQFITNSGFKSSSGKIYIGTSIGFNAFYPKNIVSNKCKPLVAITGFELFNKEVPVDPAGILPVSIESLKQIDLGHKDNVFSISFAALSYETPEKNKYAYKLEGFDIDWNVVSFQHKATYTNLPAGEYTFRVKATNNDELWNDEGAQIKIIIHPPFWLTTVFKILYILLFVSALIMIARYFRMRTERRHNEEIKELNQQKLKEIYNAKIEFFTMVAHEIRTPVSLIIGPLEKILNNNDSFSKAVTKNLHVIERNGQRLLHLVNQLLDFRKVEQGSFILTPTNQNVYSLLQNIGERFVPIFDTNNIKFRFICPDKDFQAVIDPEAITKSVSNLLSNALKYTRDSIVLLCKENATDNSFEICVQDNGNGIPDSEKEKIFNPFYQIPGSSKQGTGIGLSLVKSITEAHNGKIVVSDSAESGATFCIILPLLTKEPTTEANEVPSMDFKPEAYIVNTTTEQSIENLDSSSKEAPTLLIVEDNDDMRNFLYDNFRDEYKVFTANNGKEGMERLKANEINLIISDLMMPLMDGMEFCRAVRTNYLYSHIPFIMLTAKTDLESKIKGLDFGADSYIEKPFPILHLKALIRNLIESRQRLCKKYSETPFTPINIIAGNSSDEQFLTKMNEIIEKNISNEAFTIDQLAVELNISRSGLFAKIKTLAGITPNELIQLVRLKKAAEYISQGEYRINEIAYLVGFSNPSYFSKCFLKQFEVRPIDFARKYTDKYL